MKLPPADHVEPPTVWYNLFFENLDSSYGKEKKFLYFFSKVENFNWFWIIYYIFLQVKKQKHLFIYYIITSNYFEPRQLSEIFIQILKWNAKKVIYFLLFLSKSQKYKFWG